MKTGKYQTKPNTGRQKEGAGVKPDHVQYQPAAKRNRRNRKQSKKTLVCFSVVAVAIIIAVIALLNTPKNPLVGVWYMDEVTTYEFYRNSEGAMVLPLAKYEFAYSVADEILSIDFNFEGAKDAEYTFSIDGDTLTLYGGNATNWGTFVLHKGE